ncbi:MAG: TOBE domain-containing protein, partial [Oricola sp.]
THDQIEAMTMADRIVVMQKGDIEQVGAPLELYDTPANLFVAGFIGSPAMNFLEAELRGGDVPYIELESAVIPLPTAPASHIGKRVIAGIRPEHLALLDNGIPATVTVVEPTGSELHVFATVSGVQVTAVFRDRHELRPGDEIRLGAASGAVHLFDIDNGMRL